MRPEKTCERKTEKTETNITYAPVKHAARFARRVKGLSRSLAFFSLAGCSFLQPAGMHADVLDNSLRVRFGFDAPPVGNVVVDSSPSATHSGTNFGATWITRDAGRSGVMHFEGLSTNRIVVSAAADLNSTVGTIAFWVRSMVVTRAPRSYAIIFDRRAVGGDVIYQDPAGRLANQARPADGEGANIQTTAAMVTDGTWHHVAYAYDQTVPGFVSFYVDGVLDSSLTNSRAWSWAAAQPLQIGASQDPWWAGFTGCLDDFRVYDRVLSASEVADIAGLGTTARIVIQTGGQPLSVRAREQDTATFSVKATVVNADRTALRYQWQRDGSDISDATNATYAFPATLADSGKRFQARLSHPAAGSVTSAEATLTVEPQLRRGEVELTKLPQLHPHYQAEFSFDTNTDADAWMQQGSNLHVAFGSTDELYLRCEVPALRQELGIWEASGWKGERLNAQVLVWSGGPQEQIRFQVSELRSKQGKVISKERIKLSLVRYVLSNLPYQAKGFDCGDGTEEAAYLMPDRLEPFERFDLPARTVRPLWLSVDIPGDAEPGDYAGLVTVQSGRGHQASLPVTIHVQRQILPPPQDWKFRLDLWQNPWVVASYFHVEPWSEAHKLLLRKHLKLYADAGGKYITTYAVHSPWSDNSYALEGTMIRWLKTAGGSWKFDYSVFDQYVELAMDAGVRQAITIYTPIPWGNRFRYLDERSGNLIDETWSPKSPEFKAVWNVFLDDLKAHLQHKGWFGKAYLGINENPLELTLAAAKVIKENAKEWKITYAGDWHAELSSLLDDYSTIITREPGMKDLQERARNGLTTTYYVCCNPPQPNNFVFSAPVEGRFIGWYAAACGYSGFLRWAYDAWPADPMRDARHTLWPAGDCFLVYPGAHSSIRFEKLREGIVDYEKIRLLRQSASRSSDQKATDLLKQLEDLLNRFSVERDYSKRDYDVDRLTAAVAEGKRLIEVLSAELSK